MQILEILTLLNRNVKVLEDLNFTRVHCQFYLHYCVDKQCSTLFICILFTDGVLCLELSHTDEGEKRKWVQIRTKTVFPTVVHTKKDVIIPRHVSPSPSFHNSLSVANSFQHRFESSASHSSKHLKFNQLIK